MGQRVEDKVAIVTGAGTSMPGVGNGKASAIIYAREGARVLVVDRNIEAAEETKKIIDGEGGVCTAFEADVSNASDCNQMVEKCIQAFGTIDILHNNVGIVGFGDIVDINEETWDRVMNINLKSMFLTCKYVIPYMEKNENGSIINISSIASVRSIELPNTAYSVSKAGVDALTREIAIQYASKGIRANAILPGYMETPMMAGGLKNAKVGDIYEILTKRASVVPVKKLGDAWDTAYAALFLASDEAKYITGTTLVVDGGLINL